MTYDKIERYFNKVFKTSNLNVPSTSINPIDELNMGMDWLINKGDLVLDFGCGNGTLLFYAALKGAKKCVGIDISSEGIQCAKIRASKMKNTYQFIQGGINQLESLKSHTYDAVILSNIIDNLTEKDMSIVLFEVNRLLKDNGRLLVKLNDYIHKDDYESYGLKPIEGDLLDSGLYLLNKTSEAWKIIFSQYFKLFKEETIILKEQNQKNRLFLLENIGSHALLERIK